MTIDLRLGDCLELMREIPDKSIDAVVTDPPYGKACDLENKSNTRWSLNNGFSEMWIANKQNKWNVKPSDETMREIFRVSKQQIIWGGNYFELAPSSCWLIWDKGQRNFSFADAEMAWTSLAGAIRIFEFPRAKMNGENKIHPTQKPLDLMKWSINKLKLPQGATILDPFAGSGTTLIAAMQLGFNSIGFEADTEYYNAAQRRIAEAQAQIALPMVTA